MQHTGNADVSLALESFRKNMSMSGMDTGDSLLLSPPSPGTLLSPVPEDETTTVDIVLLIDETMQVVFPGLTAAMMAFSFCKLEHYPGSTLRDVTLASQNSVILGLLVVSSTYLLWTYATFRLVSGNGTNYQFRRATGWTLSDVYHAAKNF